MKLFSLTPNPTRVTRGSTRRLAALHVGAGLALAGCAVAAVLFLRPHTATRPEQSQMQTPAIAKPAGPTYVVENTPFGRRVRLVSPESPATRPEGQAGQAK
jgi:hypothetical protein